MGTMTRHPKWWTEEQHGSAWTRVKEAMKRDWEQTKHDVKAGGRELRQDVGDTVKQASGKEAIPPVSQPNPPDKGESWNDIEEPLGYGVGARYQYGKQHSTWNNELESKLQGEWSELKAGRSWDDVKHHVRRGYDYRGS